jgi:HEAT repeat protein
MESENPVTRARRFRQRALPLIIAAGLICSILWVALAPHEPSYRGRNLSGWLEIARQTREIGDPFSDVEIITPAAVAIRAQGKDALPVLLRLAKTHDTPFRKHLVEFSHEHDSWFTWRPQSFDDIQMNAAYGFMALGPAARDAVPELITMLDDSDYAVRGIASFALGRIGPEASKAIPALRKHLNVALEQTRAGRSQADETILVLFALGRMGPAARAALPEITALQHHSQLLVREAAQAACIRIAGSQGELDPLIEALKDSSNSTNWLHAARTIMWAGTNGALAIPSLLASLRHTNREIQGHAIEALGRIHLQPDICLPPLIQFWRESSSNGAPNGALLEAIGHFGPSARAFVPVSNLISALNDSNEFVRTRATNAFREIDPDAAARAGVQ